jgi:hypothetical protein
MKPSFKASLLAIGWYLMAPPSSVKYGAVVWDMNAPISKWTVIQSFDSAEQCEDLKASFEQEADRVRPIYDVDLCVASDDPRLQKK